MAHTPPHASSSFEPGIYFDEVHRHPVGITRRQHERLLDVVSAGFNSIAAADIFELTAVGDFAAVPALKVFRVVKFRGERERC